MKKIFYLLIITVLLLGVHPGALAIELVSPKAYSMGDAFTAVVDDATSLYWNPAGLAGSEGVGGEISLGVHTDSLGDLEQIGLSLLKGTGITKGPITGLITGYMGANLKRYSGALVRSEEIHFDGDNNYYYSQTVGNLALSYNFKDSFLLPGKTSVGVNFKLIQGTYSFYSDTYVLEKTESKKSFGLDFGGLWQVTNYLNFGASVRNVGPKPIFDTEQAKRSQRMVANLGLALKASSTGTIFSVEMEHNFVAKEDTDTVPADENILHAGIEQKLLFKLISLRAGAFAPVDNLQNVAQNVTLTAGTGMNIGTLHMDVAIGSKDYFVHDLNSVISMSLKF